MPAAYPHQLNQRCQRLELRQSADCCRRTGGAAALLRREQSR